MNERPALTGERIVEAAAAVADDGGLSSVSMRNVGRRLGVEAMSLYHHIAGKDTLLDALADWIFTRIKLPAVGDPWRSAMAGRAVSARQVLAAHPWGLGLIESRRDAGQALLRHHDAVLGCLLNGGFSMAMASHAFSVIDAYVYGFVLTEQNLPFAPGESTEELVADLAIPLERYPHLERMMTELVVGRDYTFADEFDYGLDIILDGLEQRLAAEELSNSLRGSAPNTGR